MTQVTLSTGFLSNLYLNKQQNQMSPILQLLAFQISQNNPCEIIIRISDGQTFFDATLLGPYEVNNDKLVFSANNQFNITDKSKICHLRMMIRKIEEIKPHNFKINRPQQLSFHAQLISMNNMTSEITQKHDYLLSQTQKIGQKISANNNFQNFSQNNNYQQNIFNHINCTQNNGGRDEDELKKQKMSVINRELQILGIVKDHNPQQPLTYRQILNGYNGFFVGRLLRVKKVIKQGKQSSIQMLSLGFLDRQGDMMRFNILGKMALRQQKQLIKGKCYYIKGLQLAQTKGNPYIKLNQKNYKLHVINDISITKSFAQEYYHWQHENDYIQNENVDIVGIIQDIEEKTFYGMKQIGDQKQSKQVVRVVIRNKFKTVKVSFWSDQLKALTRLGLNKGEAVIFEDVKKKKIVFLDFSIESSVIKLLPQSDLYRKIQHILPSISDYANPTNINQVHKIQQFDKYSTRVHIIRAYFSKIQQQKIIFKFCDLCKKKINIHSQKCYECKASVMSFKYNTNVQFVDYSGSIWISVFDCIGEKLFKISAMKLKEMKDNIEQYNKFMDNIQFKIFQIGIQIKNQRFILRSVQQISDDNLIGWTKEEIDKIKSMKQQ